MNNFTFLMFNENFNRLDVERKNMDLFKKLYGSNEYFLKNNYKFIFTTHSASQFIDRHGTHISPSVVGDLLNKYYDALCDKNFGVYQINSKFHNVACVVDYQSALCTIITVLPYGKNRVRPGTNYVLSETLYLD